MHLTKKIYFKPDKNEQIILGSMCVASAKLWNVANYEKKKYKELGMTDFPNWYDQKKRLKGSFWYKNLPSQSAQQALKELQGGWSSFFTLRRTGGVFNAKPPKYKAKGSKHNVVFLNNGFVVSKETIRFAIPKALKVYLKEKYEIDDNYLTLGIKNFSGIDGTIKQIEFKPLKDDVFVIHVVYEIEDVKVLPEDGKYLSIDVGVNNLFSCYDNEGKGFIIKGSRFLNTNYYFNKKIAHYQSISHSQQSAAGVKYPKSTKKIDDLYALKAKRLHHFFHAATKSVVNYAVENKINTVVIGDLKGIRKKANLGHKNNQKLHSLPYAKTYGLLEYKLAMKGIRLIMQKESYSSQCSPLTARVNKANAKKNNRKQRGLYKDENHIFNADMVGAFNILRLYAQETKKSILTPIKGLSAPKVINVAV